MIKLQNISKYYRTSNSVGLGLRKINLEFDKGEFVVVTGQSGSGKSTLLNVISGLDGYEEGEMYLFGEETSHFSIDDWEKYRALNIGYISQNYNIVNSYTVLQNVLVALESQDYPKEDRKNRAIELIEAKKAADAPIDHYDELPVQKGIGRFGPFIKWNNMFINVNKKYNFDNLSHEDIVQLIEDKQQKEIDKVIHNWSEEGIRVEKARWGRSNILKGKTKIELPKTVDAASLSLEAVKDIIEKNTTAIKGRGGVKKATRAKKKK